MNRQRSYLLGVRDGTPFRMMRSAVLSALGFLMGVVLGVSAFLALWYAEPSAPFRFIYEGF